MQHHAHVGYHPQPGMDISGLIAVLEPIKYVINFEVGSATDREHYHMYFELGDTCESTVRNHVLKYLKIPKSTRGRNSEHYCLKFDKYSDPSPCYLFKDRDGGVIIDSRGYPEDECKAFKIEANKRWPKKVVTHVQQRIFLESANAPVTKPQTEWQKLYCAALDRANFKSMSMADWKRFIKHHYLKDERPIPRAGDIQRYSYSLYAILQNKTEYSDIRELDDMEESLN